MASKTIFHIINEFRQSAPVDVEGLARALGIDVHYAYLDDQISGQIERGEDGAYRISVNANDAPTRQRFTIAHELGHYVYHRPLIGNGVDDDRAYRSTNVGMYYNMQIGPAEETEANRFAAALLMPKEKISEFKQHGLDTDALAKQFGVSLQAMKIRLGEAA